MTETSSQTHLKHTTHIIQANANCVKINRIQGTQTQMEGFSPHSQQI